MPGDKTQLVRLLDVFVFGPLMVMAARDQSSAYFQTALTVIGVGTIVYNGINYLQTASEEKAAADLGQYQPPPGTPVRRYFLRPGSTV